MKGIGSNTIVGLLMALAALVIAAVLNFRNIGAIAEKEKLVVHTHEVLDSLNLLWSTIKDGERGQRGYIITGDDEYLEPFESSLEVTPKLLEQTEKMVADNAEQAERAADLRRRLDLRLVSLKLGVERRRDEGFDSALEHVRQGRGRAEMLAIREIINEMTAEEKRLLARRAADSRTIYATAYTTAILSTGIGVALVGAVYWLASREIAERAAAAAQLERRVVERTAELNEANEALKISNRELEQFASVASHDLQEPLRKIEAFGDRLQSRASGLDEQSNDYLSRILASATRMRSLINDLLSFSRVTTKAQPFQVVELATIAAEVASDLEGRVQQSGGRIEVGSLPRIEADPLQMRQLLQNLIGNGLKFQQSGVPPVVRIEGSADKQSEPPTCTVTVVDNGIGFEEIYLDRIFNVFQRLHGRNEYEGTGMGLAICRKIVERHGGAITAKSAPGQGAKFFVTLPIEQPERNSNS